ncbi:MAG: type II toxin-antitoxin system VapC family toxin [Bryobacteraceae bacterium]
MPARTEQSPLLPHQRHAAIADGAQEHALSVADAGKPSPVRPAPSWRPERQSESSPSGWHARGTLRGLGRFRYVGLNGHIFAWLERSDHRAATSTITMTELLVQPYRGSGEQRVDEFYALLATYSNLDWISPDLEVADIAASIRAAHRLRTPDALQAATAIRAQATGLVTNDPVFERVGGFETLVLDHLL